MKKNSHEKQDEDKTQKKESDLDKELNQTFPASDPPSRTRPGHEQEDDKEERSIIFFEPI